MSNWHKSRQISGYQVNNERYGALSGYQNTEGTFFQCSVCATVLAVCTQTRALPCGAEVLLIQEMSQRRTKFLTLKGILECLENRQMNIWSQNQLLQCSCFYQRGWFFVFLYFTHWIVCPLRTLVCFHLNNNPILASAETALSRARDLGVFTKVNYSSQTGFGETSVHLSGFIT